MSIVYSAFVPHPPIIVPEVGRGEEQICAQTLEGYRVISERLLESKADSVVLVSPHAKLVEEGVTILTGAELEGDFGMFGVPNLKLSFPNDEELLKAFTMLLPNTYPLKSKLDHGSLVPLYFLKQARWKGQVVIISMPLNNPKEYGRKIGSILEGRAKNYALIASGDMSHRLLEDGPYGFHPAGPKFDNLVIDLLKKSSALIESIPEDLAEEAGECGYRSLILGLAAKEGAVDVLSYEGPFGVGYMVAELYRSSILPKWARTCLTAYLEGKDVTELEIPQGEELKKSQGCFVTLKKQGDLRGCIGTTQAFQKDLAHEILHNAIAAGTEDPRFWPVELDELKEISISVDVLGELEKIEGPEQLDPYRYGVVVRNKGRSGLLLPHLEGIDTVEEQVSIAKQKAGISLKEEVELWRFEVVRHFE